MDFHAYLNENPVKSRLLKLAAGGMCEHCGEATPLALLDVHVIDPHTTADTERPGLHKEIIILCPACHEFFHARPADISMQRELVRYRPKEVKAAMMGILGSRPRHYVVPETGYPETIFREMFESGAPDLCLNGG